MSSTDDAPRSAHAGHDHGAAKSALVPAALGIVFGDIGTSPLCGDGMITPSISVLSAVEGIEQEAKAWKPVLSPVLRIVSDGESMKPLVVFLTVLFLFFLFFLFFIQRRGTARIGRLFGPAMVAWFLTIAVLGAVQIAKHPSVLAAVDSRHAVRFFSDHGFRASRSVTRRRRRKDRSTSPSSTGCSRRRASRSSSRSGSRRASRRPTASRPRAR